MTGDTSSERNSSGRVGTSESSHLPERGSGVAGVSSFMKAASIAWLKEFWKLGTGTRSELSLSPSLSAAAGGTKLFSSTKDQKYNATGA